MNPTILPLAIDKQIVLFNLGMATRLGERKLCIQTRLEKDGLFQAIPIQDNLHK